MLDSVLRTIYNSISDYYRQMIRFRLMLPLITGLLSLSPDVSGIDQPSFTRYVSDMESTSAKNGWGPIERNMSVGDINERDGHVLTIAGQTYAKGLGVHAHADTRYNLGGICSRFETGIGIDDEAGGRGTVVFQIWADGAKLYESGVISAGKPTQKFTGDVSGRYELRLVVTDAGDGTGGDHADWVEAKVTCTRNPGGAPLRVISVTPEAGSASVDVTSAKVVVTFSKPVDHTTITGSSFFLHAQNSSTRVEARLSYDAAALRAELDPVYTLEAMTTYAVEITGGPNGIKDISGNSLTSGMTAIFATKAGKLRPRAPIVLSGQKDTSISGVYVKNLNGPCIIVQSNSQNVIVRDSELGPCQGGIIVDASHNVRLARVYIHGDTDNGSGVDVTFSRDITITDSRIERVRTGVYVLGSNRVRVQRNRFLNMQGPMPRGQFVQFDKVSGSGNQINCNIAVNVPDQSHPEDAISIFSSQGEPGDPIQIIANRIYGGGPSRSGGGIVLGDSGGRYQAARDNVLINPGQHGIGVAGGQDITVSNNRIYSSQQVFTNVGVYVWIKWPSALCGRITVERNQVNWTASNGESGRLGTRVIAVT